MQNNSSQVMIYRGADFCSLPARNGALKPSVLKVATRAPYNSRWRRWRLHRGRLAVVLQNMLIGLDGSDYSNSAVELGIRWARQTGAGLVGLGVIDEPTICRAEPVGPWGSYYKKRRDEKLLDDARQQVKGFLEQFGRRCEDAGVRHRCVEQVGLPFERILFRAEDIDLTLLGRETHFQFETQTAPDRTLKKVLRHSRRPVVVVPRRLPEPSAVVLAYDAGPSAVRVLEAFQSSGIAAGGRPIRVVSVAADEGVARRRADEAVAYFQHHGDAASAHPVVGDRPAQAILAEAGQCATHMIVMGAFEHSTLSAFFRGSVTQTVLRAATDRILFLHQ
jgi:nucleotide-binding universal stress UspA family protein